MQERFARWAVHARLGNMPCNAAMPGLCYSHEAIIEDRRQRGCQAAREESVPRPAAHPARTHQGVVGDVRQLRLLATR